jgi:hypothetical protein
MNTTRPSNVCRLCQQPFELRRLANPKRSVCYSYECETKWDREIQTAKKLASKVRYRNQKLTRGSHAE